MNEAAVALPTLVGGQAESWMALIELAETFGEHWLVVGGQMVFLHEVERRATNVHPTDDVEVVVNLRSDPAGLVRTHLVLIAAGFSQDAPSPYGAAHRYRRGSAIYDVWASAVANQVIDYVEELGSAHIHASPDLAVNGFLVRCPRELTA